MYILSSAASAEANPFYRMASARYPNLAMDLIIPQTGKAMGVQHVCRLFLFASQVLIIGGAMAIERVVKGRVQIAGFAAVMFLYCLPFTFGFLNFEFGLSVALWGIAAGKTAPIVPSYLRSWHKDFDYLYVLGPRISNQMPGLLEEIDSSARFVLYKINRKR